MDALPAFRDLFTPPDPALRQPLTGGAVFLFFSLYYAMAVLAILPHTVIIKLSLLPFVVWQAWRCATGMNFAAGLALAMGNDNGERLNHWNFAYVIGVIVMASRATEWAFTRKPLKRYEPFTEGQKIPVERPLTIPNILLDAFELQCNQRGIRWSWGPKSLQRPRGPPPSVVTVALKMVIKLVLYDMSVHIVQRARPALDTLEGGSFFDPDLDPLTNAAMAAFFTICGGIVVYTSVDAMYHMATLVGRVLLRQPAADWPALSARPWAATSIIEFWSFRWHQFFRHTFVVYGARPGGALLGNTGALFGGFMVSAVIHYVGMWGIGNGTELSAGAFFILMGVGAVLECVWQHTTGTPVRGLWGWAWTMAWTLFWGVFMLDGWARHGLIACDFFIPSLRPGKLIVDGIFTLISNN